jgi:hypothetical protein
VDTTTIVMLIVAGVLSVLYLMRRKNRLDRES